MGKVYRQTPEAEAANAAARDAEVARLQQKYGQAAPSGNYATGGTNQQAAWAVGPNAEDPTQSNLERGAERRQNFYYGGSADYANQQQAALQKSQGVSGQRFGALGQGADAGMAAAQGRAPGEFLDRDALNQNRVAAGRQTEVYNSLMRASEAPQGPSAAQAQLNQATSAGMQNQLQLARSGRGMGESAAAMQQAGVNAAQLQAGAANQSAALRAQEDASFRDRQVQALQGAGQAVGQQRGQEIQTGAYTSGVKQAGQSQADATALGYGNLGLGAAQGQSQADLGYFAGQNQVAAGVSASNQGYEQNLSDRYLGLQKSKQPGAEGFNWGQAAVGAGTLALMAASDERAKTNIEELSDAETQERAQDAVSKLHGYDYDYKDPDKFGTGPQTGFMAQELEQTPLGSEAIKMDRNGTKIVDLKRVIAISAAALGGQARELKDLKKQVSALQRARA